MTKHPSLPTDLLRFPRLTTWNTRAILSAITYSKFFWISLIILLVYTVVLKDRVTPLPSQKLRGWLWYHSYYDLSPYNLHELCHPSLIYILKIQFLMYIQIIRWKWKSIFINNGMKMEKVKIIKVGKVKMIKQKIEDKQTWWDMWVNMFHPDIFHLWIFFFNVVADTRF